MGQTMNPGVFPISDHRGEMDGGLVCANMLMDFVFLIKIESPEGSVLCCL